MCQRQSLPKSDLGFLSYLALNGHDEHIDIRISDTSFLVGENFLKKVFPKTPFKNFSHYLDLYKASSSVVSRNLLSKVFMNTL
jgi:hypothetical protein